MLGRSRRAAWTRCSVVPTPAKCSCIHPNAKNEEHRPCFQSRRCFSSSQGLQAQFWEISGIRPWPPNTMLWQEKPLAGWPRDKWVREKNSVVFADRGGWMNAARFASFCSPSLSKGHWRFWKILHSKLRCRKELLIKWDIKRSYFIKKMQCLGYDVDIPASEEIVGAHVSLIYQKKGKTNTKSWKPKAEKSKLGERHILLMVINHWNKLSREEAESHLLMFSQQMHLLCQRGCFQQIYVIGLVTRGTGKI